jgi:hypothetical protein
MKVTAARGELTGFGGGLAPVTVVTPPAASESSRPPTASLPRPPGLTRMRRCGPPRIGCASGRPSPSRSCPLTATMPVARGCGQGASPRPCSPPRAGRAGGGRRAGGARGGGRARQPAAEQVAGPAPSTRHPPKCCRAAACPVAGCRRLRVRARQDCTVGRCRPRPAHSACASSRVETVVGGQRGVESGGRRVAVRGE